MVLFFFYTPLIRTDSLRFARNSPDAIFPDLYLSDTPIVNNPWYQYNLFEQGLGGLVITGGIGGGIAYLYELLSAPSYLSLESLVLLLLILLCGGFTTGMIRILRLKWGGRSLFLLCSALLLGFHLFHELYTGHLFSSNILFWLTCGLLPFTGILLYTPKIKNLCSTAEAEFLSDDDDSLETQFLELYEPVSPWLSPIFGFFGVLIGLIWILYRA